MRRKQDRSPRVDVIAPKVRHAAKEISARLTQLGYRHALIGGLAVSAHGYSRTTEDVDFLVSATAASELAGAPLGGEVRGKTLRSKRGVTVDLLFPDEGEEFLEVAIRSATGNPPVIPQGALVYMKLVAGRMKDQADLVELIKRGKIRLASAATYLRSAGRSDLVAELKSLVSLAEAE